MRILHAANFSWFSAKRKRGDDVGRYYSSDRKISNGLIRNGHAVWDFSCRDAARYLSPVARGKKLGAKNIEVVYRKKSPRRKRRGLLLVRGYSESFKQLH